MRASSRSNRLGIGRLCAAVGAAAGVAAGVAVLGSPAAYADAPATIVYQCADGQHICSIDPSGDGKSTQLSQTGTLAGVTRDGTTYGYAAPSSVAGHEGLWQAPVAGGTPKEISTRAIGATVGSPSPEMSPDGSAFLEQEQQLGIGFSFDSDDIYRFDVSAGPAAEPAVVDSSTLFGMTYGWIGDTAITAHAADAGLEPPTWACIGYEGPSGDHFCTSTDPTAKLQSASSVIAFPSGSPDGSEVVAALGASGKTGGAIVEFSASTGAMTRTVATPPAGSSFTVPRFSPDGKQIVFESDPASGSGASVEVVSATGGTPRTVAQGADPYWGGTGSTSASKARPRAPKLTLRAPRQTLKTVRRSKHLTVTCRLNGGGTCTVRATIPAGTARHLKLTVRGKHAKTDTLATASRKLRKRGTVTLRPRLSGAAVKALGRTRRLTVTLAGTSSAPRHRARTASRRITLR